MYRVLFCVQLLFIRNAISQIANPELASPLGFREADVATAEFESMGTGGNNVGNRLGTAGVSYGSGLGFTGVNSGLTFAGYTPTNVGYNTALNGANFGAGFNGAGYGGVGNGVISVSGNMPVTGTTIVAGHVPILGVVQFNGNVPAAGTVSITGNCVCGKSVTTGVY